MPMIPIPIERKDGLVKVVRCKDCKFFELDHFENYGGMAVIVAHEICSKWGNGCKTDRNGYCFMGERKTDV